MESEITEEAVVISSAAPGSPSLSPRTSTAVVEPLTVSVSDTSGDRVVVATGNITTEDSTVPVSAGCDDRVVVATGGATTVDSTVPTAVPFSDPWDDLVVVTPKTQTVAQKHTTQAWISAARTGVAENAARSQSMEILNSAARTGVAENTAPNSAASTEVAENSPEPEFVRDFSVLRGGGGSSYKNNQRQRRGARSMQEEQHGPRAARTEREGNANHAKSKRELNTQQARAERELNSHHARSDKDNNNSNYPFPRYENRTWKKRDDPGWPRLPERDSKMVPDMDKDRESTPLSADGLFKKELHSILNSFQTLDRPLGTLFIGDNLRDPRYAKLGSYFDHVAHRTFSLRDARQAIGSLDTPVSRDCRKQFILLHEVLLSLAQKTHRLMQQYKGLD